MIENVPFMCLISINPFLAMQQKFMDDYIFHLGDDVFSIWEMVCFHFVR